MKKLETVVESLEGGNVSLEDLVKRYEEGMEHLKKCRAKLADAELRIRQLRSVDADGNAQTDKME
ncbi:MAG: exodeoxyribonuclease VII small subunit [Opitutales bacterium]|nr:exodeoxyribonuclease VII small subunit [Opitutales bacterium]